MERIGLRFKKTFAQKGCTIAAAKKVFYGFFHLFSFCLNFFAPLIKGVKSPRAKKKQFFGKFCLPSRFFFLLVLLSANVEKFFVSRMRDFYAFFYSFEANFEDEALWRWIIVGLPTVGLGLTTQIGPNILRQSWSCQFWGTPALRSGHLEWSNIGHDAGGGRLDTCEIN